MGAASPIAPGKLDVVTTSIGHTVLVDIRGEADLSTDDDLQLALTRISLDDVHLVCISLTRLTFCDVRALCHLNDFMKRVKNSGTDLSVQGVNDIVQRVCRLMGFDAGPNSL